MPHSLFAAIQLLMRWQSDTVFDKSKAFPGTNEDQSCNSFWLLHPAAWHMAQLTWHFVIHFFRSCIAYWLPLLVPRVQAFCRTRRSLRMSFYWITSIIMKRAVFLLWCWRDSLFQNVSWGLTLPVAKLSRWNFAALQTTMLQSILRRGQDVHAGWHRA